jgi:hypothetical protein
LPQCVYQLSTRMRVRSYYTKPNVTTSFEWSTGVSIQRCPENELLEEIDPNTEHVDVLATIGKKDWGSYSEDTVKKADPNFLVQRNDIIDVSRIEFEEDKQGLELVNQKDKSSEVDININDL